ncbi:MAG: helix-turn-helix transcriptional regulator [Planctomycetota bacterium]
MIREMLTIRGKRCVAIEETELRRLERQAGRESPLPPLPAADAKGNRPALEYLQVSIARDIINERRSLGLSQLQLAELAGLRQETLSRIESGKHSPTVRTVEKIDQALNRYAKSKSKPALNRKAAKCHP